MERVWFPICHACGERPWTVDPRQVPVVCDGCGRLLDHFMVVLRLPVDRSPRAA